MDFNNAIMTKEKTDEHFQEYLERFNGKGGSVEELKSLGIYDALKSTFEYAFIKGVEETLIQVKDIINGE